MRCFKIILILLTLLISFESSAQLSDKELKRAYFKGSFQLPTNTGGNAYRKLVSGIADVNLSFHKPILPKFHVGVLGEYGIHLFNDVAIQERTEASFNFISGMLSLSYSSYSDSKAFVDVSLNGGYQTILAKSLTCGAPGVMETKNYSGVVIKPKVGVYFKSNENLSFGLTMSYNYSFIEFGPETLCLTQFSGFDSSNFRSNYQFFAIGFGFKSRIQTKK